MKNNIAYHSFLGDLWSLNTKQSPACLNQCWNPWWKLASKRQSFPIVWYVQVIHEVKQWAHDVRFEIWPLGGVSVCDRFVKLNSKSACAKSCCQLKSSLPCPLINGKTESHAYEQSHPFPIPILTCQTISKLGTFSCLWKLELCWI